MKMIKRLGLVCTTRVYPMKELIITLDFERSERKENGQLLIVKKKCQEDNLCV